MLSEAARRQLGQEEFAALRDPVAWSWRDLKAASVEPDSVVVEYTLIPRGGAPRQDFLQFTLEGGAWVRPYNWGLLKKAEAALEKNDPDLALLLSRAAVEVNPRDPMARAYLCEAGFYRRAPEEAGRECELALRLHERYPSKLSERSLFHLHAILGDTYKNALRRPADALREYNTLLSFPGLTAADRCKVISARSETLASMGRAEEAAVDARAAAGLCARRDEPGEPEREPEEGGR